MPWSSEHITWFSKIDTDLSTSDGKKVTLLEFIPDLSNTDIVTKWARHFRNHYCFDSEIDLLSEGTGKTKKDYLLDLKFPSTSGFGPGIRSGDFSEILVADYLEFVLGYWVPRTRYGNKIIRDESTKGSDLIGFKMYNKKETVNDILTLFEVKAQFSGDKANPRLQDAINDSIKDELRKAESLNGMKQRLLDKGKLKSVKRIARFQNPVDKPFTSKYGAAALFSNNIYNDTVITDSKTIDHPFSSDLYLIVIKGEDLMKIVHNLYKIAADEA